MFEPLALVAVAAAQLQVPVMKPVPVAPSVPAPVIAPVTVEQTDAGKVAIKLLPDLIVDQVRVEDDRTAHFRITNKGTADARGAIRLTANAYIGSRSGNTPMGMGYSVENLAIGESKWVAVAGFAPTSEPYYAGKDYSFPLGKATAFFATVDPPVLSGGLLGGGDPSRDLQDMFGGADPKAPKCDSTSGCIRETDETNNYFKAEGDAVGRGKPE